MKTLPSFSPATLKAGVCAIALALTLTAGLSGCLAVVAGAGAGAAVAYVRGDLQATLPNDYQKVVKAAQQALTQLEFSKPSENKDALKAVMVTRTALDKKVEITLENKGNKQTSVKIRVGLFGDESLSMSILDKIKSNL